MLDTWLKMSEGSMDDGESPFKHSAKLENVLTEGYENGKFEAVIETLRKVLSGEIDVIRDRRMVRKLVEREVLFFDLINRIVRFQTHLDERVAREMVEKDEGRLLPPFI